MVYTNNMRWMQFPREIYIGEKIIEDINNIIARLFHQRNCIILSGRKTYNLVGRCVEKKLSSNFNVRSFIVLSSNYNEVLRIKNEIDFNDSFFIIAIGGGKVIDIAKVLAKETDTEFVSIPTCASHDGISSSFASIFKEGIPYSIKAKPPYAIIADLEILKSAPYRLTASGCGDLLAKFSAIEDWKLARRIRREPFSEYAANLALMAARTVIKYRRLIKRGETLGIKKLIKALVASGISISIANSSRPASGAEHKFAHALDIIKPGNDILHGEKVSLATIFFLYLHGKDWKRIREIMMELRCPTSIYDVKIDKEDFIQAILKAREVKPDRFTILEYKNLSRDDIVKICEEIGIF